MVLRAVNTSSQGATSPSRCVRDTLSLVTYPCKATTAHRTCRAERRTRQECSRPCACPLPPRYLVWVAEATGLGVDGWSEAGAGGARHPCIPLPIEDREPSSAQASRELIRAASCSPSDGEDAVLVRPGTVTATCPGQGVRAAVYRWSRECRHSPREWRHSSFFGQVFEWRIVTRSAVCGNLPSCSTPRRAAGAASLPA